MGKGRQKVRFEGLLQRNVLGIFTVIRGFADLRDLADVSVAIPYEGSGLARGTGYQRALDEQHVEDLKKFLHSGRYRFFPEIVLSLRSKGVGDPVVSYSKRRASESDNAYRISVDVKTLIDLGSPIKRHLSREKSSPQARRSVFLRRRCGCENGLFYSSSEQPPPYRLFCS